MSIRGSDKEFYFNLFLRERKRILEHVTGAQLDDLLLEYYWNGLKLDIYGYDRDLGTEFIVESVLTRSNGSHQEKVKVILESMKSGTIVYQAISFQEKHVRELERRVIGCNKPIRLLLIEISDDVIAPLELLDAMNKLDVYWNINSLEKVQKPLRMYKAIVNARFSSLKPQAILIRHEYDFSRRSSVNLYLLHQLRKTSPNFLPLQREKRLSDYDVLHLGGGRSGIEYFISAKSGRGLAFVELRFTDANSHLFHLFAMKPWLLKERIDSRMVVGENVIACRFRPYESVSQTVFEVCGVFEKMVKNVSYELYKILDFERVVTGEKEKIIAH